jgi:uncharacterized coiled-coil protein SlyX
MKKNEENNPYFTNENKGGMKENKDSDTRKKGGARGAFTIGLISLFLLITAGIVAYTLYNRERAEQLALMESQRQSFEDMLIARDSTINEWMLTLDQIEENLETIVQKENLISVQSTDAEFTPDRKEQILDDIKQINTLLDLNKKKIAALNAELKKSGGAIKGFQERISELEMSIKQRESEITDLKMALVNKNFEIEQLNTRMTDLQITIAHQDEEISNQIDEMNTAYLAYGTYKDLKEKGIISKEGGFLGLGKKESLVEDFADSLFSQVNITDLRSIPVNSKDARLITEHPTNSYELIHEEEDKIAYIEIKDPDIFWKISKYAVVEIIE